MADAFRKNVRRFYVMTIAVFDIADSDTAQLSYDIQSGYDDAVVPAFREGARQREAGFANILICTRQLSLRVITNGEHAVLGAANALRRIYP